MFTKLILAVSTTLLGGLFVSNAAIAAPKPYQVTRQVQCPAFGCTVTFEPLTAPVLLKHVACNFAVSSTALGFVTVYANNPSSLDTEYPPFTNIGSLPFGGELLIVNSGSFLFGDKGSSFSVATEFGSSGPLQCTISGEYIDPKDHV
jgi:hypothetical protein